ncbi:TetR/AcrR family transcriptional regulator [Zhongshania guokunii]|uniref:TetR/AcrR family transcriptional regulator n=1 Tax=Zhongshania guokunii TaxID=641783 RepID=A0ABV3U601_9GAMM
MATRRNTKQRILDIAENLFAQQGFAATSVSEIAAQVGISSPGIYKHYSNKFAIYEQVCERLFTPLAEATQGMATDADFTDTRQQIYQVMSLLASKPNTARIVQHATLAKDETLDLLSDRWYRQFFASISDPAENPDKGWIDVPTAMAFHCMILGYVTLAPLHHSIFGVDPLQPEQLEAQLQFQQNLVNGLNQLMRQQKNAE